jgi:hypothetical protein
MTYAFEQELPFSRDLYERFRAALPDEADDGLIMRVVFQAEAGLRSIEVWESLEHYDRYLNEMVQPIAMDGLFEGTSYQPPDREPTRRELTVIDLWAARTPQPSGKAQRPS